MIDGNDGTDGKNDSGLAEERPIIARHEVYARGKRYSIKFVEAMTDADGTELRGLCDPPDKPTHRTIRLIRGQTPEGLLDSVIHEMLHACLWDLDESAVLEIASDIAKALTKIGYSIDPKKLERLERS